MAPNLVINMNVVDTTELSCSTAFVSVFLALCAVACNDPSRDGDRPDDVPGVSVPDEDGPSGEGDDDNDSQSEDNDGDNDDDDDVPDPDGESTVCEEWDVAIEPKPPRLMILQDISGSMVVDQNDQPVEKWNQAKAAISGMLDRFDDEVEFGVDVYSNDGNCGVGSPVLSDTAPNNGDEIMALLEQQQPVGATPIYRGMQNFLDLAYAPRFAAVDASSTLVVVTDGSDTCGPLGWGLPASPGELRDVTSRLLDQRDIRSIAIGFGGGIENGEAQLNAIAEAGGTPFDTYIHAQDEAELESSLEDIVDSLVSCVYVIGELDNPDVNPNEVNFYLVIDDDGNEVEQLVGYDEGCAQEKGWQWADFDTLTVEFCKATCERLQEGDVVRIKAEFGCDTVPVE